MEGDRIDDAEVEEIKLESTAEDGGASLVKHESDLVRLDYEMEEGEIVEEDGLADLVNKDSDKLQKNSQSDAEIGGIKKNSQSDVEFEGNKKNSQSDVEFGEIKTNGCHLL